MHNPLLKRDWRTSSAGPNEAKGLELSGSRQYPDSVGASAMSTSLNDQKMERIRFSLGLSNMVVVKGDGRGGGIAMLWRKGVNMILRNYSINIDVVADDGFSWRFTGI